MPERMSALGHSRRFWPAQAMSALPPLATRKRTSESVRLLSTRPSIPPNPPAPSPRGCTWVTQKIFFPWARLPPRHTHYDRGSSGGRLAKPNRNPSVAAQTRAREGHLSTAGWSSSFLLSDLIFHGFHAAATACSRLQRNSVPSTQMRCMITASRRASATIAFFMPRRLAICIAQAFSQDHFLERIMA